MRVFGLGMTKAILVIALAAVLINRLPTIRQVVGGSAT